MKQKNREVNFNLSGTDEVLYIVDYQWLKTWVAFLQG